MGTTQQLVTPTVSAGTGTVTYSVGSSDACTVNSTGLVTITHGTGTCAVTAAVPVAGNYAAATTATPVTITVSKANVTLGSFAAISKVYGSGNFTITEPSVSGSVAGTWSYSSSNSSVISISGSTATLAGAGSATITATFTPTATGDYNTPTALTTTATVSQGTITPLSVEPDINATYGDADITLSPTAAGSASGSWSFSSATTGVASVSGNVLSIVSAGSSLITATFTPTDSNYSNLVLQFTIYVAKKAPTFVAAANVTKTYGDAAFTLTSPTATPSGGSWNYVSSNTAAITINNTTKVATVVGAGTAVITGTYTPTDTTNYLATGTSAFTVTVNKASQTALNLTLSPNTSTSNGSSFSQLVTASTTGGSTAGAVTLAVANGTATGCALSANTSPTTITTSTFGTCQVTATMAGNDNYQEVTATSTFTFYKKDLLPPANLQVTPVSGYTNRLTVRFDSAQYANQYILTYSSNNWATSSTVTNFLAGQANTLSGLSAGTTYKFKIYITQDSNLTYVKSPSALSSEVSATTYSQTATPTVTNASGTLAKTVGQSLSLTANVSAGTSLSYQWKKDGVAIAGATSATYSVNSLLVSHAGAYTCDITDTANGITSATATYTAETVTVAKANPTLGNFPNLTTTMASSLMITSQSPSILGGTFDFTSSDPSVATVAGIVISPVALGTTTITATYTPSIPDQANYNIVSTTFTVTVTSETLATPSAPTVTAAATGRTMNVSWNAIANASGYLVKMYPSNSTSQIGATQTILSGTSAAFTHGSGYTFGFSTTLRFTVQAIGDGTNFLNSAVSNYGSGVSHSAPASPTFTELASITSTYGSTVEFTITDAAVTDGGVISYGWQYLDTAQNAVWQNFSTAAITNGSVVGGKTLRLTNVTMAQSGYKFRVIIGNTYQGNTVTGNTNGLATLTVNKASQTITFGALSNRDLTAVDFNFSASSSSGLSVSFTATNTAVCTVTGSTVHIVAAGTCTIAADQSGTANYEAATQVTQSFTISAATQTITFGSLSNRTYSPTPFTLSATSTAGFTVSFTSATPSVCTVSGTSVTMVSTGNCTINADQAGDSIYAAATQVSRTFEITAASISAPVAPTLTATAGVLKSIDVSWAAITNSNGYLLKLYNNAGTTLLATIPVGSTASTTLDATDYASIADDTPYKVSIIAVGATNYANSAESSTAGVTTNKRYTISYRSTGATSGNPPASGSYITGAAATAIAQNTGTLARTGYTFAGWNTLAAGNGTNYTANGTGTYSTTEDVELHPVWTPNAITVTFNSNFGTPTTTTQTFIADAAENLDANTFVNPGYTFMGWATSAQGQVGYSNGQSYTTLVPITFYAKWQAIDYSIEYRLNNGTGTAPTEADQNVGDVITMKPITGITRTGYDFMGWSDGTTTYAVGATYTVGTTNVVLTAQWQIQTYTITYDVNNASGTQLLCQVLEQ